MKTTQQVLAAFETAALNAGLMKNTRESYTQAARNITPFRKTA
jgi:hypothetical protein